jgi:hypothetical protein
MSGPTVHHDHHPKGTTTMALIQELRDDIDMTRAWVHHRVREVQQQDPDRGSHSTETVIWIAAIAIAAIAIAAVIVAKIRERADSINMQ